eukprot:Gb_11832 [translate_table: standard]
MQNLCHLARKSLIKSSIPGSCCVPVRSVCAGPSVSFSHGSRHYSGKSGKGYQDENDDEEEWNEAWESAWIPEDSTGTDKAPWEGNKQHKDSWFSSWSTNSQGSEEPVQEEHGADAKQFLSNINDKMSQMTSLMKQVTEEGNNSNYSLTEEDKTKMQELHKEDLEVYTVDKLAKDYRIKKQRVHATMWLKEIEKEEEAKLGTPLDDDIEQLLDNCSEFFDYEDREAKLPHDPNFKVMPEGWEGLAKDKEEKPWEISQKEEDILLQEFERRMAFNKIQINSFIKSHIFSRRRPIDGWKYMIEELGPNAKRGKGGGQKFTGAPNGSRRAFDDEENMPMGREIVRPRS